MVGVAVTILARKRDITARRTLEAFWIAARNPKINRKEECIAVTSTSAGLTYVVVLKGVPAVLDETMEKTHLRVIMLHEFKLRRSVSEATQNIKIAWGEDSAKERTMRRWYQKFRVGDVDLEGKDRSGRPAKYDDGRLKERVEADSRGTVGEMGRELQ
ncbi:unnamed protein product, partial [Heligmosomoides polygyrus]|uniref:HTH_48 domain-containing protein n=1 Tax=Heligmosomoides polygyrus TaxID=6339 RepID=A0A183G298_HELPZ